ncbi:MAG: 30S ribosomal protein S16 [Candidatus Carsonella ruddii]
MIVIRLTKKKKKFYYINVMYRKNSIYGKIIKRIGFCNFLINFNKIFYIDFNYLFYYIKKGAKLSKRLYDFLIL